MANQAISQLPVSIALDGTELVPLVQQGSTKRTTTGDIATLAQTTALPTLSFQAPLFRSSNTVSLSGWTATVDNGVLYRASAQALTTTAAGLVGQLLTSNGASAAPSWLAAGSTGQVLLGKTSASAVWLSAPVTGQIFVGNTSAQPSWFSAGVAGQLLVSNTTAQVSWLAAGVSGQVLVARTSDAPLWTNISALPLDLDVGSSTITGGVSGRVLYDNGGILGEMTTTGSGTQLVLSVAPTISSPTVTGPLTYGGVTLAPAVSGTSAMVASASPTLSGTLTVPLISVTGNGISLPNAASASPATMGVYNASGTQFTIKGGSAGWQVVNNAVSVANLTGDDLGNITLRTGTLLSGNRLTMTSAATVFNATAIPAGGTAGSGYLFSSTSNFGTFFGSGAPTLTAAQGSIYVRSDANVSAPLYYNTNGTTGWGALATTAGVTASILAQIFAIQTFTASSTYTPNARMINCVIETWGGGGAGGGTASAATNSSGAGGGAGGYSRKFTTRAAIGASQTVTIGAAGTPGAGGNVAGGNGGDTSVGVLCVGKGATGGGGNSGSAVVVGGSGGIAGTGDLPGVGATGEAGFTATTTVSSTSNGASSGIGGGGKMPASAGNGGAATGYAAGGGGGLQVNNSGVQAGGAGSAGYVFITEYCSA